MKRPYAKSAAMVVALSIASLAIAANWTGQGSDMYWDIGQNWSNNAIPTATDSQNVVNVLDEDGTVLHPIVYTLEGGTDVCANLFIGTTVDGTVGDGTLDMIDGNLAIAGNVHLGSQADSAGLMNMEDGFLEVGGQFNVGQFGDGHLRMAGGHIIAHGTWMHIPNAGNSTGKVDLFGGTLETTATFITRSVARSLVDLSGGSIVVPTANADNLAGFIADGRIIAYGGRGTVNSEVVDSNTVLTGTADPDVVAKAWHESPVDGDTLFNLSPTLAWVAGEDANSHQVYLGTDPNALELLPAEPNQGVLSIDFHTMVEDLAPGTTYFWRVDEVAADAGVTTGDLWSFVTVPPETSRTLSPADGSSTGEITGVVLTWEPGVNAVSFNVYWAAGADELEVVSEAQIESNYPVPGILIPGQTYRWRIDTSNGTDIFPGLEVSFTAGNPPANTTWTDASADGSLWNDPNNWSSGIPGLTTTVNIINGLPLAVIDANTDAYCAKLQIGTNVVGALSELEVTGGSLTVEGELLFSRDAGTLSTLYIRGGSVTVGFLRGWLGDMWVEITGGEFNCTGDLEIPREYASNVECAGVFNLHGGVARVGGSLILNANANVVCRFDITQGKLILDGDQRSKINGYVAAGLVTAYYDLDADAPSQTASISMAYDAEADETTVIACEKAWQADFNADCVVDEKDRDLLVAALGDTTMAEAVWDFDMSTDPVGTDFWDLFVRVTDGAPKGDYVMDNNLGVMTLPGGNFTLDHQQNKNVSGAFDMDLRIVAKSTSTAPIRVWFPIESSATPGTYALPHTVQYLDGATQTVEISNGAYWWVGDYAPLVLTGFAADAFVDTTINCDQETDSLVYTVTDGTKTETGNWDYISSGGGGNGGDWVLLTDAGGTGVIDDLTVKIHGTQWNSPYDINLDGIVDQLDLDILEAEMAQ